LSFAFNISQQYSTDDENNIVYDIEDPAPNMEDSLIRKEEIINIRQALLSLDNEYKDKQFLTIFTLRYIKGKRQVEIANDLKLSQGEVSKRLLELSKRILSKLH
jgi:RNA polymerase sigma factor (sigma-70 family)